MGIYGEYSMLTYVNYVGGLSPTPLKNDGVNVSWDYELPN
jgi:hypothetical protein